MSFHHDGYDVENDLREAAFYGTACELCLSVAHLADTCAFQFDCHVCGEDGHDYDPNGNDEVAQWYNIDPNTCRVAAQGSIAEARGAYDLMRLAGSNSDVYGHYADLGETDPVYARYLAQR